MKDIHTLTEALRLWSSEQRLEERSLQCFFQILEASEKDAPANMAQHFPDRARERFLVQVTEVYIMLRCFPEPEWTPYIVSCIPIIYDHKHCGWYRVVFDLSGDIFDDVWEYDVKMV